MKLFMYNYRGFEEKQYVDYYSKELGVEVATTPEAPSPENLEQLKGFDCISIITTPTDRAMLTRLKELGVKGVLTRSIGVNHIDVKAAKELGIVVCNASYPPDGVANFAIMLMLMSCRKVVPIMKKAAMQEYALKGKKGKELSISTVGVLGTGRIGRTVIEHLSGFGCKILAYDVYENESVKKYATYVDKDTLLAESDIITIHVPFLEENYHFIGEEELAKMKDGVILINTARGELVDTQALIRAIESGKIGSAALDVLEDESDLYYKDLTEQPLAKHERAILASFPNVILTPHVAFYTEQSIAAMIQCTFESCVAICNGEQSPHEWPM